MAFTGPNRPGGHFTNRSQFTPTGTGFNSNMASQIDNSGAVTPTSQYGPAIGSQHQSGPNCPTAAAYSMQPFVQFHPNAQNHPIVQNHPVFHNVGVMVSTNTLTPGGVPNNTAFNARHQRQVVQTPYPIPMANQTLPSANASMMAQQLQQPAQTQQLAQPQLAQPVQLAAPQKSDDELVREIKDLLKEKGMNFGGHIRNFGLAARYREAERRVKVVPTPELAKDFPTSEDEQMALVERIWDALVSWVIRNQPSGSKMAIKRLKSIKSITFENAAWDLMVFKNTSPSGS